MFIGRKKELDSLEIQLKSNRFEMAIIYGRRRIGKTTLIKEFIKSKRSIFFTATQTSSEENLLNLTELIDAVSKKSIIGSLTSFQQAFEIIDTISYEDDRELVFVIDEFPYLAESTNGISSILQKIIYNK